MPGIILAYDVQTIEEQAELIMASDLHPAALEALLNADHGAPFDVLGPRQIGTDAVLIRAFRSFARTLSVVDETTGARHDMTRLSAEGLFEVTVPGTWPGLRYHFEGETYEGHPDRYIDPYQFAPTLTDYDLYLFGEGSHLFIYEKLGAHICEIDGIKGVRFAVWAPNAKRVSVIGNFNRWDERLHPMRLLENSGVWELFIPGLGEYEVYKFSILSRVNQYRIDKTDPYGFSFELRPKTAAVVADLDKYIWHDDDWMEARAKWDPLTAPLAMYEVHLGSWRRKPDGSWLTYRELAHELIAYAKDMGFTHLELLPVSEHPFDGSWGYQTTGYFAPTSRFGTPEDFMYFVDHAHQNGIGVILDWVPAHFPKDGHALSYFDGTHLYEHADPRQSEHPDWGTYIFNYGRHEVRNFLLSNALFWLKRYHIDGLRVDAVSSMIYLNFSREEGQWVPNQYGGNENLDALHFLREFNEVVYRESPGAITIAEESTSWPMVSRPTYLGGLGFTFKWDMGWMHDTLEYIKKDPVFRRFHHNLITFSLLYAFSENFILSLSHDEVVHMKGSLINKAAGDWWQKFATLRALFGFQYTHSGKKLNFMGQEFGQWNEWSEARALDWFLLDWPMHAKMQAWMRDLNRLYLSQPALYEQDLDWKGFQWIDANDADQSVFTYLRFARDTNDFLVIALNFTPVPRYGYRVGVPAPGRYAELLNSDSEHYGGGNVGNSGGVESVPEPSHGFPHMLSLTIPPLGIVVLKLAP
jgi:1,4-alpha-glucan branching enzyme